jgi:hypothetical protein
LTAREQQFQIDAAGATADGDALTVDIAVDIAKVTQPFKEGVRSAEGFSARGRSEGIPMCATFARGERETWCERGAGHRRLELLKELAPRVSRIALLAAVLVDLNVDVIVVTGF